MKNQRKYVRADDIDFFDEKISLNGNEWEKVEIPDISAAGLCFCSRRDYQEEKVRVSFTLNDPNLPPYLMNVTVVADGVIVRKAVSSGRFEYGVKLNSPDANIGEAVFFKKTGRDV